METILSFGDWLTQRRSHLALTQADLAAHVSCSVSTIRKIEYAQRRPSRQIAQRLITSLHIHQDYRATFLEVARGVQSIHQLPQPQHADQPLQPEQLFTTAVPVNAVTRLIGRSSEHDQLLQVLTANTTRMVTLSGLGGVGKTHLAQAVVTQLDHAFPDGIIWIDLSRIQNISMFPALLATTMDLNHMLEPHQWEHTLRVLAKQRLLLVFDSCEHLAPELATYIVELLSKTTHVAVLATSRVSLHIYGEILIRLRPFAVHELDPAQSAAQLLENPAVALFVERTQQRGSELEFDQQTFAVIVKICQALDGLALALELAAARTRVLSLPLLLENLAQPLKLLQGPAYGRPARHQTLYHTVAWSYSHLTTAEQYVFNCMGLWTVGVDLPAISAVCQAMHIDDALDVATILDSLIDMNLIFCERSAAHDHIFTMLNTLRSFAYATLQQQPFYDTVLAAYADHLIHLGTTAMEAIKQDSPIQRWIDYFQQQHPNICGLLEQLVSMNLQQHAVQLLNTVAYFWNLLGYWQTGIHWYERIQADAMPSPEDHVTVLRYYGLFLQQVGVYEKSIHVLEQAIHYTHQYQLTEQLRLSEALGHAHLQMRQFAQAQHWFQRMYDLIVAQDQLIYLPLALINLASTQRALGHIDAAFRFYYEALEKASALNKPEYIDACHINLAAAYVDIGQPQAAQPFIAQGFAVLESIKLRRIEEFWYQIRGRAAVLQHQYDLACSDLKTALTLSYESGHRANVCEAVESLALVALRTHRPMLAAQLYTAAQTLRTSWHIPAFAADAVPQALAAELAQHDIGLQALQGQAAEALLPLEELINLALSV